MSDLLDGFITLFRGRGDCYGSWDGGCVRAPLTHDRFKEHLGEGPFIGVYPNLGTHCAWGCVDIDVNDVNIAVNLRAALMQKGITTWVEKTRKGYHVWLFVDGVAPARDVRRCLQAACAAIGYNPKEVNPKQEELHMGHVGNYVRLPYPGGDSATERKIFDLAGEYIDYPLHIFVERALQARVSPDLVAEVARYYTPPQRTVQVNTGAVSGDEKQILDRLSGLAYTIWRDGPLEGHDRSNTLARLAHRMQEEGFRPEEAYVVIASADRRWGKFSDRPDGELQLAKIVEVAYR